MKQIFFTSILALILSFPAFSQNDKLGCAAIEVSGGGVVQEGTAMSFSAIVTGMTKNTKLEYDWKVSNGTIADGQGTSEIKVDTTGLADGTNISAEVKINGLYDNCPNTASEIGSVSKPFVCSMPMDEFGKIPNNEVRARVDSLFIALGNEMNAQLYIINYGTDAEVAAREKLIRKHAVLRKYDASRVTFIKAGANPRGESGVWTRAWLVPPGAQPPTTEW